MRAYYMAPPDLLVPRTGEPITVGRVAGAAAWDAAGAAAVAAVHDVANRMMLEAMGVIDDH